jgi:hypothetical protein
MMTTTCLILKIPFTSMVIAGEYELMFFAPQWRYALTWYMPSAWKA